MPFFIGKITNVSDKLSSCRFCYHVFHPNLILTQNEVDMMIKTEWYNENESETKRARKVIVNEAKALDWIAALISIVFDGSDNSGIVF